MKKKLVINVCGKGINVQGHLIRVARIDGEKFTFSDDPESVLARLKTCGTRVDLFTFMPSLNDISPQYTYKMELDNLAVLPVSTFDHWFAKQVDSKLRNMVRKAEKKGVNIREVPFDDALLRGICEIYNECPIRQGQPFPHYGMDLDRAREYAGTFLDRSSFIGAFLDDNMIGFIKLVTDERRTQAHMIHILSMLRQRDKAPTNALIAQAVRFCATRGIRYLVYDHFSYGNKPADSLSQFKEANGFRRVNLPRYYIPLTPLGWAALQLGLHHRFVDHLPETVAAKLREFRTAWYNRKLQSVTEAL